MCVMYMNKFVDIYFSEKSAIRTTKPYITETIKTMMREGLKANRVVVV